jgi:hypothetical protein
MGRRPSTPTQRGFTKRQKQGPKNANPEPWIVEAANAGTKQRKSQRTKGK